MKQINGSMRVIITWKVLANLPRKMETSCLVVFRPRTLRYDIVHPWLHLPRQEGSVLSKAFSLTLRGKEIMALHQILLSVLPHTDLRNQLCLMSSTMYSCCRREKH